MDAKMTAFPSFWRENCKGGRKSPSDQGGAAPAFLQFFPPLDAERGRGRGAFAAEAGQSPPTKGGAS